MISWRHIKHLLVYFVLITGSSTHYNVEIELRHPHNRHRDADLNFTEITAKHGYLSEEHTVETEDGFLLTIFRIVAAKKCVGPKRSPPVILQHGLLGNSELFLDSGPDQGLAYLLADECHDVWVGNQRGTNYGRRHIYLDPDKDADFWKWSIDEIGYYDIPSTIDYVLADTGAETVNYLGYSQGCGTFYIMCSERPEYCKKVQLKISIAPATRHLNAKGVGFRLITQIFNKFLKLIEGLDYYEAFPNGGFLQEVLDNICRFESSYLFCMNVIASIDSLNPGSIPFETLETMSGHIPAGTSSQNLARYGQAMKSAEFQKFDYGFVENFKIYGSFIPPPYNLKAMTVPVLVLYGKNDGVADQEDVKWTVGKFQNLLELYEVHDPLWTHFDFAYSRFARRLIYKKINHYLEKYSSTKV